MDLVRNPDGTIKKGPDGKAEPIPAVLLPVGKAPHRAEYGGGWTWAEAFYDAADRWRSLHGRVERVATVTESWRYITAEARRMGIDLRRPKTRPSLRAIEARHREMEAIYRKNNKT
jgi:hypothetical protein